MLKLIRALDMPFASVENYFNSNEKEHLSLNSKTRIYKNTDNFLFLGRNSCGRYARYRTVKRKLKNKFHLYEKGKLPLDSFVSSLRCYRQLCNNQNLFNNELSKLNSKK